MHLSAISRLEAEFEYYLASWDFPSVYAESGNSLYCTDLSTSWWDFDTESSRLDGVEIPQISGPRESCNNYEYLCSRVTGRHEASSGGMG